MPRRILIHLEVRPRREGPPSGPATVAEAIQHVLSHVRAQHGDQARAALVALLRQSEWTHQGPVEAPAAPDDAADFERLVQGIGARLGATTDAGIRSFRGLPVDVTPEVVAAFDQLDGLGSVSWVLLEELLAAPWASFQGGAWEAADPPRALRRVEETLGPGVSARLVYKIEA